MKKAEKSTKPMSASLSKAQRGSTNPNATRILCETVVSRYKVYETKLKCLLVRYKYI